MRRDDLQLLRVPRFRRLWLARTISILGSALTPVALAFGVLDLPGAGARELALVVTAASLAMVATILLGGVLGDRFPRTKMLMIAEALAGVSAGAVAFLFISGRATPGSVAALAALAGGAEGLLFPVLSGLVPETAPADRLQSANAFLKFSQTSAQIGGSALAGVLVAVIGAGWTMALDAASFAIAVVIVARIPATHREPSGASMLHELREGWRGFISFKWIWATTLAATIWIGGFHASFAILGPVVAKSSLGGAPGWALVLAAFSIGGVLGTFVATRVQPKRPMVVVTVLFQPGTFFVAMLALPASLPWMIVAAVGLGVSFSVIGVLWDTLLQTHVPTDLLSRVASYDALGSLAAVPIATAVVGSVAAAIGVQATLEIAAVVMVVAGLEPLLVRDVWRVGLAKASDDAEVDADDGTTAR
ncbi:MAG: MFS transporter [Actinomycetota bacterium]